MALSHSFNLSEIEKGSEILRVFAVRRVPTSLHHDGNYDRR